MASRFSDYNPLNSNFRAGLERVFARVRQAALGPSAADREAATRRVAEVAAGAALRTYAREQDRRAARVEARGAPGEPPQQTEGVAPPISSPADFHSKEKQAVLNRRSTRYEQYAARTGWGAVGWSTYQELTLDRIRQIHDQVDFQGVMLAKDDTDRRVLRRDAHILGIDRARRSKVYRSPLNVSPFNRSREARICANFIRQIFDNFDGLTDGVSDMLYANAAGVSAEEVIWSPPAPMQVVVDRASTSTLVAEGLASLKPIPNRYLKFDVSNDRAYIDHAGSTVDPYSDPETGDPTYKVLVHETHGDGHGRQRGYMFSAHYLHSFKQLSWEKWITVLELYGSPNPYLARRQSGWASDQEKDDAYQALEEVGKGIPTVINEAWGELKTAPMPAGVDSRGVHAAIHGAINGELSKAVQGETLTAETGGSGSYKMADVHENQQDAIQIIDARRSEVTLRTLARFLIEVNRDELARVCGVPPEVVVTLVPRIRWFLDRKVDPVARLGMFETAMVDMKLPIDPQQIYDEFHFRRPDDDELPSGTPPAADDAPPAAAEQR